MSEPIIQIRGLSKRYHIGVRRVHDRFLEYVMDFFKTPLERIRRFGRSGHRDEESVWAMRDISLDVYPGEVLGLIGANGAGKSTLLKILSRITMPTEGTATLRGRVGSLLEIGTGFHLELTGRENIFLSGHILGMSKTEIRRQFDAIVDFAGVKTYLDTPVKRYSSGMRVRLGFAVAAHLQPEILLIDEVLAVGDAEFQAKCLGRMDSIARGGRTILFVSHDLEAIQKLCPRSAYFEGGQIAALGDSAEMVRRYLDAHAGSGGQVDLREAPRPAASHSASWFNPLAIRILGEQGNVTDRVESDKPFAVEIEFTLGRSVRHMSLELLVTDRQGRRVAVMDYPEIAPDQPAGTYRATCRIPAGLFSKGVLRLGVSVREPRTRETYFSPNLMVVGVDMLPTDPGAQDTVVTKPDCTWEMTSAECSRSATGGDQTDRTV